MREQEEDDEDFAEIPYDDDDEAEGDGIKNIQEGIKPTMEKN